MIVVSTLLIVHATAAYLQQKKKIFRDKFSLKYVFKSIIIYSIPRPKPNMKIACKTAFNIFVATFIISIGYVIFLS